MSIRKKLGMDYGNIDPITSHEDRIQYLNFKLAALGLPIYKEKVGRDKGNPPPVFELYQDILEDYREKHRMIDLNEIGIHKRINNFLDDHFSDVVGNGLAPLKVMANTLTLDQYGLARELSLPPDTDTYSNPFLNSYRIKQGVLHNPKNDRRTTEGSFHIAEGGMAIPFDKKAVPKPTFARLYHWALNPPSDLLGLPFTSTQAQEDQAKTFVSLLLKPIVSPEVPGISAEKSMEILVVAPGALVSNLDFLESVFGNAGDPCLHFNDSGLDVEGWSGHTGYIVLAPHLTSLRKIDVGLPPYDEATDRQRADGMCYQSEDELYNGGNAFKLTCRTDRGIAITLIADNYYGYSKKEVKTQISFAANLYGNVEEEHAGGTIAYVRMNVGEYFNAKENASLAGYSFEDVKSRFGAMMDLQPNNYGIDKRYPRILYLPENIEIDLHNTQIKWVYEGVDHHLRLTPNYTYVLPNGVKLHMEKHPETPAWKLISTEGEGTFCHKPCTVSGGGKSEISKSISNAIIYGTYYVQDLPSDLDYVQRVLDYDYRKRWRAYPDRTRPSRPILSVRRTLGSVIKLLTPSTSYSDTYNTYLEAIPNHVKALVFMVKRFYLPEWGDNWRSHFTVDLINGRPGNELNFNGRKIRPSYLRVGFGPDGAWRIFKLRMDFMPSEKIQMEDDITASIMVPLQSLESYPYLDPDYQNSSYKFAKNCEYRFFQRPDDAIHKGFDRQAERDLSQANLFVTNFEPLNRERVQAIYDDVMSYMLYTDPVKHHIEGFLNGQDNYCVVSSEPRIVGGAPSKNPRYLEHRADFVDPMRLYLSEVGVRLSRRIPLDVSVLTPVNAVLPGRRNNPKGEDKGKPIRPLSVYNPLHYQELPELFIDFITSLTGKSPSTTGAGSEGAMTKGPFNMLLPIYDLNAALLGYILGDYHAFSTPAGHIGSEVRVDHDISMLIPEIWSRMTPSERAPQHLIAEGSLERLEDFTLDGQLIPASRLGYRITETFAYTYLGKIFDEPQTIFSPEILRPELQDLDAFADGVLNIVESSKKAALAYFEDGSYDLAIPPLKALLSIMAHGTFNGHGLEEPAVRMLFDRERVLTSPWYHQRLLNKQGVDLALIDRKIQALESFMAEPMNRSLIAEFGYDQRLQAARALRLAVSDEGYPISLIGTLGQGV